RIYLAYVEACLSQKRVVSKAKVYNLSSWKSIQASLRQETAALAELQERLYNAYQQIKESFRLAHPDLWLTLEPHLRRVNEQRDNAKLYELINIDGYRTRKELLNSDGMRQILESIAEALKALNADYDALFP